MHCYRLISVGVSIGISLYLTDKKPFHYQVTDAAADTQRGFTLSDYKYIIPVYNQLITYLTIIRRQCHSAIFLVGSVQLHKRHLDSKTIEKHCV